MLGLPFVMLIGWIFNHEGAISVNSIKSGGLFGGGEFNKGK
jgi:hypothetical protein